MDREIMLEVERIKSATAIEVARINAGADLSATVHQAVIEALAAAVLPAAAGPAQAGLQQHEVE